MKRVLALVLAGGWGKRMDVLCHLRPKSALPFAGRYRVIDFSLSSCVHSGVSDVAVLIDYQRSHMVDYLRSWRSMSSGLKNLDILEPMAGSYKGTADAVYQNLEYLRSHPADTVLILAGDHVYKMNYRQILAFHRQMKADVTVGITSVPIKQAYRFGIVTKDPGGRIVDFVEKPRIPQSNLTSMGIYMFDKRILAERLKEDATRRDSPHDFGYAVIPGMVNRDKVFAYEFRGYWRDIGTAETYYEANMELIKQHPSFSLDSTRPIFTEANDLPPPRVSRQGSVMDSLISPGCVIKGRVEKSVLSPGVCVEEQAVVRNSIVMTNSLIGYHSVVDRCILDERVNVGELCYFGFGSSLIPGNWDIIVIGKDVSIPPHTAIGRGCRILPGTTVTDFPKHTVPPGSILPKSTSGQR